MAGDIIHVDFRRGEETSVGEFDDEEALGPGDASQPFDGGFSELIDAISSGDTEDIDDSDDTGNGDNEQEPRSEKVRAKRPPLLAEVKVRYGQNRYTVWRIRNDYRRDLEAAANAVTNFVLGLEKGDRSVLVRTVPTNEALLLAGYVKHLYEIDDRSRLFNAYIHDRYGLSIKLPITAYVTAAMRSVCLQYGERREVRRFTKWDAETKMLYISRYDGTVWRLDGTTITIVNNGRECFFLDDDHGSCPPEPIIGPHGRLIPALTKLHYQESTPGGITPAQQAHTMTAWLFATAFPDLLKARPVLIVEGAPGSGKSVAMQNIQLVLHGRIRPIIFSRQGKAEDFGVQLLRSPIAVLDNLDSFVEWLQDAICAYATTGIWLKRKLFTNDEEHEIRPQAFLAVPSANPSTFRRADLADRCLVLRLDRIDDNRLVDSIQGQLTADRPYLYGEWLYWLNRIVAELRKGEYREKIQQGQRMADFASMVHIVGQVLGWEPGTSDGVLEALQSERDAFIGESDALADVLDLWLENRKNVSRQIVLTDLYQELSDVASKARKQFYRSANTLLQKLRSPHLRALFTIDAGGEAGKTVYKIRRTK